MSNRSTVALQSRQMAWRAEVASLEKRRKHTNHRQSVSLHLILFFFFFFVCCSFYSSFLRLHRTCSRKRETSIRSKKKRVLFFFKSTSTHHSSLFNIIFPHFFFFFTRHASEKKGEKRGHILRLFIYTGNRTQLYSCRIGFRLAWFSTQLQHVNCGSQRQKKKKREKRAFV